ncbi:MAG: integral rane sensor signal transduction histidine kinase, partial [Solirubrobacterales bacterium]|nr:integral rane sensor signal transduction histidine kinase [Solirubrobacterales bacterium]
MSFRTRVVLLSATAVTVAIVLASALVYVLVRSELRGRVDSDLRTDATRTFADPIVRDDRLVLPRGPLGGPTLSAQLVEAGDGAVIGPSDRAIRLPVTDGARAVAAGERDAFFEDAQVDGTHVRVYTTELERGEALQVARSLEEVDDVLDELALVLALVSLAGLALGAGLGVLVSRAALTPVARLSRAAREVAATRDLSRRIDPSGGNELGELARSFNTMLNALQSSIDSQRQLVADASHELRTPLASLRTNIEVLAHSKQMPDAARERVLADVIAQLDELTVLVGDLVDLARDAELDEEAAAPLRLDRLVDAAVERARTRTATVQISLTATPCTVHGVESSLERAVTNLLDNAIKWSPEGGEVAV